MVFSKFWREERKQLLFERWSTFPEIVWPNLRCHCENSTVIELSYIISSVKSPSSLEKLSQSNKIVIFSEITKAKKSVGITQLTHGCSWFVSCIPKVVREASFIPDALKTTLILWHHINLLYHASVQLSPFFCLSKVNSSKFRCWNTACTVYSCHEKND